MHGTQVLSVRYVPGGHAGGLVRASVCSSKSAKKNTRIREQSQEIDQESNVPPIEIEDFHEIEGHAQTGPNLRKRNSEGSKTQGIK